MLTAHPLFRGLAQDRPEPEALLSVATAPALSPILSPRQASTHMTGFDDPNPNGRDGDRAVRAGVVGGRSSSEAAIRPMSAGYHANRDRGAGGSEGCVVEEERDAKGEAAHDGHTGISRKPSLTVQVPGDHFSTTSHNSNNSDSLHVPTEQPQPSPSSAPPRGEGAVGAAGDVNKAAHYWHSDHARAAPDFGNASSPSRTSPESAANNTQRRSPGAHASAVTASAGSTPSPRLSLHLQPESSVPPSPSAGKVGDMQSLPLLLVNPNPSDPNLQFIPSLNSLGNASGVCCVC